MVESDTVTDKALNLISLADKVIPIWRSTRFRQNEVFARELLITDLLALGLTQASVAEKTGIKRDNVQYYSRRSFLRSRLTEEEQELKNKWDFAKAGYSDDRAKLLAWELCDLLGENITIVRENGKITITITTN